MSTGDKHMFFEDEADTTVTPGSDDQAGEETTHTEEAPAADETPAA